IDGELCKKDSDCCGANLGSGLPGAGNVTCAKVQPTDPVGVCRNPSGCDPEGDTCRNIGDSCSLSQRNDCCAAAGANGMCVLDPLGVPRCLGVASCQSTGATCASSADCCNAAPCIPDGNGVPRCALSCSANGGPCTAHADCCQGL